RGVRVGPAQLEGGAQALVGEGRRHPDVRDYHVGPLAGHRGQQRLAVGHLGANPVALVLQQPDQAGPEQRGVLGDHDAHQRFPARSGSSTVILVGPPGGLAMSRRPSTTATRWARPDRPLPREESAPPTPSSVTRRARSPARSVITILIVFAWLCLAALASSSAAQK